MIDSVRDAADCIIVVDNGSTDRTVEIASQHGATVTHEPQRGYGAACLRGLQELRAFRTSLADSDIVLFLDADASDHPDDVRSIIEVMRSSTVGMCIGSRTTGLADPGALTPQQRFGNWLSTTLIHLIWQTRYTDLGPLRAIRWDVLEGLQMEDRTWGWTVEMQIKIAKRGISFTEIPVRYRRRIGQSKISGTVVGSIRAGIRILSTIAQLAIRR
ncbi:MAG: hypothetical protein RL594_364 [Bacteroidota bacterium]